MVQRVLSAGSLEEMVRNTPDLPVFPTAALAVMRETDASEGNATTVSRYLSQDAVLTARVLRLANSAHYSHSRQVTGIQDAVVLLGMKVVKHLALVAASYSWLSKELRGYAVSADSLWNHSLCVGIGSKLIAQKTECADPDVAFVSGLLHNIGKIVLSVWLENKTNQVFAFASRAELSFDLIERKVLGFDHCQVGAHLAGSWNLPEPICQAIRWHHEPQQASEFKEIVQAIHVADFITMRIGFGLGVDGMRYLLDHEVLDQLSLESGQVDGLMLEILDRFDEEHRLFEATA